MDIKLVIYYLCIAAGGVLSAVIGYNFGRKSGFQKDTLRTYIGFGLLSGIFSAFLMGQLQNFIMSQTGLDFYPNRLRIFGALLFLPLCFFVLTRLIGGDFGKVTDIFTAGTFVMLGFSKIGCAVYGCCYGIPFEHGVTTPFQEFRAFPVQLLECALCLITALIAFLIFRNKKHRKGTVYPISLILYGVMRFFAEFLRYYPEEERSYFFGINFWQMICVISILFAAVLLCPAIKQVKAERE